MYFICIFKDVKKNYLSGGRKGNISDLVGTSSKNTKHGVEKKKKTLQTASNENLKIENFKLGEKIRIAEKEIARYFKYFLLFFLNLDVCKS